MLLVAMFLAAADPVAAVPPAPPAPPAVVSDDGFRIGIDTLASVTAKLGKPMSMQASSDGTATAIYSEGKTHIKGSSFIPIVGAFTAGARSSSTVKIFTFGADGMLRSFSSTNTSTNCHVTFGGAKCS